MSAQVCRCSAVSLHDGSDGWHVSGCPLRTWRGECDTCGSEIEQTAVGLVGFGVCRDDMNPNQDDEGQHIVAPNLTPEQVAFLDRPEAPESLRERVAAALAAEDQQSLLSGPLGWHETQRRWPDAVGKYRRMADAAIGIVTESALR